ncbi:MAG: hypothetical protein LBV69_09125 [Bacteroidales bacterium]|jgi:uncharacterized protein YbbC (DUF1343 family)|nr:hypothetical protein [Bacteroidales bacterium]
MKKKIIINFIFIFLLTNIAISQNQKCTSFEIEKIKSQKIAFITESVELSVKEAQSFWPLFNEQEIKMNKLFSEEFDICNSLKTDNLSEKIILEKTDRIYQLKIEKAQLEQESYEKYKKILSVKKIALLYQAEKDFKKSLMKKVKEN